MNQIQFDMDKINQLKESYNNTVDLCEEDFPQINLNSFVQVKSYFRETYNLDLPNMKIGTVVGLWALAADNTPLKDALYSLLIYLRSKYTLKNYINCIVRHETDGIITLREVDGRLLMPNKQPLSYNEEIIDAMVASCDEASRQIASYRKTEVRQSVL